MKTPAPATRHQHTPAGANSIGLTLALGIGANARIHTVVGVLPPIPQYPGVDDVFMPATAIDRDQPIDKFRALDVLQRQSLAPRRLTMLLLALFAALALTITASGIGGVVAFAVTQRTQEIGVHLAMGAEPRRVLYMVVRQGMQPVLIGLALGVAGAALLGRLLRGLLYGVSAADPATLAGVTVVVFLVAATACLLPARRAVGIDPVMALRG